MAIDEHLLLLAENALKRSLIENDLSLKEAANKISRSVGTIKRAIHGSMGVRTANRILKEFGSDPN
jgi:hypothetical protein